MKTAEWGKFKFSQQKVARSVLTPDQYFALLDMCESASKYGNVFYGTAQVFASEFNRSRGFISVALKAMDELNIVHKSKTKKNMYIINPSIFYTGSEEQEEKAVMMYVGSYKSIAIGRREQ